MTSLASDVVYSVYLLRTSRSKKVYVGYTNTTPELRFAQHKRAAARGKHKVPLQSALRKYPESTWSVETLYRTKSREVALKKEIYFIKKFGSFGGGYNATPGGDGGGLGFVYERTRKHKKAQGELIKKLVATDPRFFDEKHRANLSLAQSGERNHAFGKKAYSRGDKVKFFEPGKQPRGWKPGNVTAGSPGESNPFYGKTHSPETLAKLRASLARHDRRGANNNAAVRVKVGRDVYGTKKEACAALGISYVKLTSRLADPAFPTYTILEKS